MRKMITVAAALLALGALGCAGDVGEHGATLRAVDEHAMTSQVLYMAPDVSPVPMTIAQLAELGLAPSEATPVRVEIFDELAVAWYAPAGEAIISRNTIVALWDVVQRQTIAGEVADPSVAPVVTPTTTPVLVLTADVRTSTRPLENASILDAPNSYQNPAEQTIIDFFDRVGTPEEIEYLGELIGYHPGCT